MTGPRRRATTRTAGAAEVWRRWPVVVRDLPLGVALLAGALLLAAHGTGTRLGGVPDRALDAGAFAAVAAQCLPLAVRRRWPLGCVLLVAAGFAVDQLRGYHTFAGGGLPVALLSAGIHLERYRRTACVLLAVAYVPLAVALARLGAGEGVEGFVTFFAALALAWGVGVWLRSTRAEEAERRCRVAEETRTAERSRIARELHDVVTHHVTAMVVQAEAARYLTAAPERLERTLTAVTETGRHAIGDLRHLLDLLDPGHGAGPHPRSPPVGRLGTLVEQTRRTGQPVEFREEGEPAGAPGSAGLVAYRVVQEALTNALKYAHGGRTSVLVRHGEREITVEVRTAAPRTAQAPAPSPGGGRGLAGLRERVEALGGDFAAGPGPGAGEPGSAGFLVRARIPARGRA